MVLTGGGADADRAPAGCRSALMFRVGQADNCTFAVARKCTLRLMDVAVTELRAHLGQWIDAARDGNDVVITDRGTPVARIVALDSTPVLDRLTAEGVISRPARSSRPVAGGRSRPKPKRPVADIVSEQRG